MPFNRKNISLHDAVEDRAQKLIAERGFSGMSDLVASLIREEYERLHPPSIQESAPEYHATSPNSAPAHTAGTPAKPVPIPGSLGKELEKLQPTPGTPDAAPHVKYKPAPRRKGKGKNGQSNPQTTG